MQAIVNMLLSKVKKYNPDMNEAQIKTRKYGLEILIGELSKTLIYLFVFSLFSLAGYFLLAALIFCTIRLATGGLHARSYLSCLIVTFIIFAVILFAGQYFELSIVEKSIMLVLSLASTILFAPVKHMNTAHKNLAKAGQFKLISILFVIFWSLATYLLKGAWSNTAVFAIFTEAIMQPLGKLFNPTEKV